MHAKARPEDVERVNRGFAVRTVKDSTVAASSRRSENSSPYSRATARSRSGRSFRNQQHRFRWLHDTTCTSEPSCPEYQIESDFMTSREDDRSSRDKAASLRNPARPFLHLPHQQCDLGAIGAPRRKCQYEGRRQGYDE
jgi:hypothetical protein